MGVRYPVGRDLTPNTWQAVRAGVIGQVLDSLIVTLVQPGHQILALGTAKRRRGVTAATGRAGYVV
jgi:hypothetical protein